MSLQLSPSTATLLSQLAVLNFSQVHFTLSTLYTLGRTVWGAEGIIKRSIFDYTVGMMMVMP